MIDEIPLRPNARLRTLGDRAHTYRETLKDAGRIVDCGGGTLRFPEMFEHLYKMRRARMADGNAHHVLDAFMSDGTWHRMERMAYAWIQGRFNISRGEMVERHLIEPSMEYFKFEVADIGAAIAAFTDWKSPVSLPNQTVLFSAMYDLNSFGEIEHPEYHLLFENFAGFGL